MLNKEAFSDAVDGVLEVESILHLAILAVDELAETDDKSAIPRMIGNLRRALRLSAKRLDGVGEYLDSIDSGMCGKVFA